MCDEKTKQECITLLQLHSLFSYGGGGVSHTTFGDFVTLPVCMGEQRKMANVRKT